MTKAPYSFRLCYNIKYQLGMTGFDGGGWSQVASREAPTPQTQRKNTSANRTSYAALPLAA